MPAPATKEPFSPVTWEDMSALATYADGLGLIADAASTSPLWSYDVPTVGWLQAAALPAPGVLNKIRRDLRKVLEDIHPIFGSRGWPTYCCVSGPWVLPPSAYYSGGVPGTDDGLGTWAGIPVASARSYSRYTELRCIAWEDIYAWNFRSDINFIGASGVDGGGVHYLDQGWSGIWNGGLSGWTDLTFTCSFNPACHTLGYANGADGYVYVTLAGTGADVTATVNGQSVSVTEVPDGGAYRYQVDVTGLSTLDSLAVAFTWTSATYGAAVVWGCYFSAQYEFDGANYDKAFAETPAMAFAGTEFSVTASGETWQLGDVWAWPSFADTDARGTEQFCIMAKTWPVIGVYHNDYKLTTPRLNPRWSTLGPAYYPELWPVPAQRSDTAAASRDGLEHGGMEPAWTVPTSPGIYRCESCPGVMVWRRGNKHLHEPLLQDVLPSIELGNEITITLGVWRGGTNNAALPRVWTGGEFDVCHTFVLPKERAYAFERFEVPWPGLELKALVWQATPDEVEVSGIVVAEVALPGFTPGTVWDWDATWTGDTPAGFDRNGDADIADFPTTPDNSGDPWIDFPPSACREAPPVAYWNDTLALLSVYATL